MNPLIVAKRCLAVIIAILSLVGCNPQRDMHMKEYKFKNFEWNKNLQPRLSFAISDTTLAYNIYFVVRHHNYYGYNNLRIQLLQGYVGETPQSLLYDFKLGEQENWIGEKMSDVIEYTAKLNTTPIYFTKETYTFVLMQQMAAGTIGGLLSTGIRIEKAR